MHEIFPEGLSREIIFALQKLLRISRGESLLRAEVTLRTVSRWQAGLP